MSTIVDKRELAVVSLNLLPYLEAQAKERQATSTGGSNPQLVEIVPQAEQGKAREQAAERTRMPFFGVYNFIPHNCLHISYKLENKHFTAFMKYLLIILNNQKLFSRLKCSLYAWLGGETSLQLDRARYNKDGT